MWTAVILANLGVPVVSYVGAACFSRSVFNMIWSLAGLGTYAFLVIYLASQTFHDHRPDDIRLLQVPSPAAGQR